MDKNTPTVWF